MDGPLCRREDGGMNPTLPQHLHAAALLFFKSFFLSAHGVINKFLHPIQSNFLAFVVYRGAQKNMRAPDSCPQVSLRRAPNLHFY